MIGAVFTLPRRGLVGGRPVGADYMATITERAKRLKRACRDQEDQNAEVSQQIPLPFPPKIGTDHGY